MSDGLLRRAVERATIQRAYDQGFREGRLLARAELNAEWRERISNVLAILQKPIPTQKDDK